MPQSLRKKQTYKDQHVLFLLFSFYNNTITKPIANVMAHVLGASHACLKYQGHVNLGRQLSFQNIPSADGVIVISVPIKKCVVLFVN